MGDAFSAVETRIEVISSSKELGRLRRGWDEMAPHSPAYPFTSYLWQETWWQAFGKQPRSLMVFAAWAGQELVGLLPLMRTKGSLRGFPLRLLTFCHSAAASRSDVLVRDHDPRVLAAMVEHLRGCQQDWDCLILTKVPAQSATVPALQRVLQELGYDYHVHHGLRCPYVTIDGDWETFLRSRPVRFRKSCRNKLNRSRRLHTTEVEEIHELRRFSEVYEEICHVSARSRLAANGKALTSRPERVWFYRRLAELAAELGWLSTWTLRFDGKMVAYEYHLRVNGVNHGLLASYDEDYQNLSPGSVLDYNVVRALFLDGRVGYDQGGGESFYKLRWTDSALDHVDIAVFPKHSRGALAHAFEYGLVTSLRAARGRLLARAGKDARARRFLAIREDVR